MKANRIQAVRLNEIEQFVCDKKFSFSKKHERLSPSDMYNESEYIKLKMAFYLPFDQIICDIQKYDCLETDEERKELFDSLCLKYDQPKIVIDRRIQDVRRIINYRKKQK